MHRYTDPDCLIDFRELLELLPNAKEDELASEFITGRVPALVRNRYGTLDEYALPMAYDAKRDAWRIDRAGAREGRFLFRLSDVKALAGRHPKWTPLPEPYFDPDRLPEWVWRQNSEFHTLSTERDELALYARQLEEELQTAFATVEGLRADLAGTTARAEQATVLKTENERLKQDCEWLRTRQKALCQVGAGQEAELKEQRRRIAELQAELATAKAIPCIGDGFRRLVCDMRRQRIPDGEAARRLASESAHNVSDAGLFYLYGNDEDVRGALTRREQEASYRSGIGRRIRNGANRRDTPETPRTTPLPQQENTPATPQKAPLQTMDAKIMDKANST